MNKSKNGEEEANLPGRIPDNFCRSCPSRRWASPPRQLWAVLRASFPKARGGEEERRTLQGGNQTVRTQPGDGVSPGGSHSDSRHPETTQGLWAFTSLVSSPKPRAFSLVGRKTSDRFRPGDIVQHTCLVLLKNGRVIRTREVCETVSRGGSGDMTSQGKLVSRMGSWDRKRH